MTKSAGSFNTHLDTADLFLQHDLNKIGHLPIAVLVCHLMQVVQVLCTNAESAQAEFLAYIPNKRRPIAGILTCDCKCRKLRSKRHTYLEVEALHCKSCNNQTLSKA